MTLLSRLVGLLVVLDTLARLPLLRVFYSDEGVLPRHVLLRHFSHSQTYVALHSAAGSATAAVLLAAALVLAGCMLAANRRPAVSSAVALLLLCSQADRNPLVLVERDALLRVLTFWTLVANMVRGAPKASRAAAWVALLVRCQLALCFVLGALMKQRQWAEMHDGLAFALVADTRTSMWARDAAESLPGYAASVLLALEASAGVAALPHVPQAMRVLVAMQLVVVRIGYAAVFPVDPVGHLCWIVAAAGLACVGVEHTGGAGRRRAVRVAAACWASAAAVFVAIFVATTMGLVDEAISPVLRQMQFALPLAQVWDEHMLPNSVPGWETMLVEHEAATEFATDVWEQLVTNRCCTSEHSPVPRTGSAIVLAADHVPQWDAYMGNMKLALEADAHFADYYDHLFRYVCRNMDPPPARVQWTSNRVDMSDEPAADVPTDGIVRTRLAQFDCLRQLDDERLFTEKENEPTRF